MFPTTVLFYLTGKVSCLMILFFLFWPRSLASAYQEEKQPLYRSSSTKRFLYWCHMVSLCSSVTARWMVVKSDSIIGQTATPSSPVVKHVLSHICCNLAISGTNEKHADDGYHIWSCLLERNTPTKQKQMMCLRFCFFSVESPAHKYTTLYILAFIWGFVLLCNGLWTWQWTVFMELWRVLPCGISEYCFKYIICRYIWSIVQFSPQV